MKKYKNIKILWDFIKEIEQEYRQSFVNKLIDLNLGEAYPIPVSSKTKENIETLLDVYNRIDSIIEKNYQRFQTEEIDPQWATHTGLQILGLLTILSDYQIQILEIENFEIDKVLFLNPTVQTVMNYLEIPINDEEIEEQQNITQSKIKIYERVLKQGIQNLER